MSRPILVVPALLLGFGAVGAIAVNTIAGLVAVAVAVWMLRDVWSAGEHGTPPEHDIQQMGRHARGLPRVRLAHEHRHPVSELLPQRRGHGRLCGGGAGREGGAVPAGGRRHRAPSQGCIPLGRRRHVAGDPVRERRRDPRRDAWRNSRPRRSSPKRGSSPPSAATSARRRGSSAGSGWRCPRRRSSTSISPSTSPSEICASRCSCWPRRSPRSSPSRSSTVRRYRSSS